MSHGLCRLTPAYDLSGDDLRAMVARSKAAWFEAVIRQRVPMFHMAHCVFARLSGASDCRGCSRPCLSHDLRLRDRNGVDHPVRVDAAGRNTVFRGQPESRIGQVAGLMAMGVRDFRIELLDESAAEAIRLVGQAAVSGSR
jgi:putative protease